MGIVELKGSNVDVTCQTTESALELYGKLRNHEKIEYVKLYESDKVYVTLGWVPTPFPQELIQKRFKEDYGEILKIFHKKDRKGLFFGARIMVMNANDLEKNLFQVMYISKGMRFLFPTKVKCLHADIAAKPQTTRLPSKKGRLPPTADFKW